MPVKSFAVRFEPTALAEAYVVRLEPRTDARGMFARAFCAREFAALGLETNLVQTNISVTAHAGTVRGLHFQRPPHEEVKLVRCVKGAIYDVMVDMRQGSPTRWQWFGAELSEDNGAAFYVPRGFAHGFQTLTDGAAVLYQVSAFYAPEAEGGLRYDDPTLGITWPRPVTDVSPKDAAWALIGD
jgi:dTDP-4-dehydrorhamnose 3,5-epimerase